MVTVHRPGTGTFFGPLGVEKCACPFPQRGGQFHFRGLRRENRDSPRERLRFPPALGDELHFVRVHSGQPRARKEKRLSVRHGGLVVMRQYTPSKAVNRVN